MPLKIYDDGKCFHFRDDAFIDFDNVETLSDAEYIYIYNLSNSDKFTYKFEKQKNLSNLRLFSIDGFEDTQNLWPLIMKMENLKHLEICFMQNNKSNLFLHILGLELEYLEYYPKNSEEFDMLVSRNKNRHTRLFYSQINLRSIENLIGKNISYRNPKLKIDIEYIKYFNRQSFYFDGLQITKEDFLEKIKTLKY